MNFPFMEDRVKMCIRDRYTRGELAELSDICQQYHIPLYLDGARLGYGLAVEDTDVTMEDIAEYCDIFYIGGTKVGAFCGEAVVFTKENAPRHFVTLIKQHGALLALSLIHIYCKSEFKGQ